MKNRFQQSKNVLSCDSFITIVSEQDPEIIFDELWRQVNDFEERFSRFKISSELTKINDQAGQDTKISNQFYELAKTARDYSIKTDGIFNPFILPNLMKAGYSSSWPITTNEISNNLDVSNRDQHDFRNIILTKNYLTIPEDSAIDFGGIGKGYLLDQLAKYLIKKGYKDFWISLGGDIICSGKDIDNLNWKINIADANNPEKDSTSIEILKNRLTAIATSGTTKRKGDNWHHLIDPATQKSAKTDILSCTVVSDSATNADILAKVLTISSSNEAIKIAKAQNLTVWLQVLKNGRIITLENNWSNNVK